MAKKPGIHLDIPGFGRRHITAVVSDYTGTCSEGGTVRPDVKKRLRRLAKLVDLHILTADTFGTAERQLGGVTTPHFLSSRRQDEEKRNYVSGFDLREVAALGNGNNDRRLLAAVKKGGGLSIAIDNGEGCAIDALRNAHLFIAGAANALELLLDPRRLKATLRF